MAPDLFLPPRDLVLRPTDLSPGFYETHEGPVVVTRGPGEGNFIMLWDAEPQPGDLVFKGAYLVDSKIAYEGSDAVFVEESIVK